MIHLIEFVSTHLWHLIIVVAVIWVVVVFNKNDKTIKRYDVNTYADKEEMKKRLKSTLKNKGGGEVDIKGKRGGFTAENDDFYADVSKGPRTKGK